MVLLALNLLFIIFSEKDISDRKIIVNEHHLPSLHLSRNVSMMLFGYDCISGFLLICAISVTIQNNSLMIFAISAGLILLTLFAICLFRKGQSFSFSSLHRVILPLFSGLLIVFLLNNQIITVIAGVIAFAVHFFVASSNTMWLHGVANAYGFNIGSYIMRGRRAANTGLLLGLALGLSHIYFDIASNSAFSIVFAAALLVAFAVLSALLPFYAGTPIESGVIDNDFKIMGDAAQKDHGNSFRFRCDALASQHKLTSREAEVMLLLARGYSAESIAQTLFLATSTVKTHSTNIYRKIDIHSRQELLRLIDPELK